MTNALFFTPRQSSIVIGSLLGDGCIQRDKYSYFSKNQSAGRREYLEWLYAEMQPFSSRLSDSTVWANGKEYGRSSFATRSSHLFNDLRQKWYPTGKKIVPRDIVLDPLSIAVWYCDDGSNDVAARSCKLATYCFSRDDCEFLIGQLQTWNIVSYIDSRNTIKIRSKSYNDFLELVRPHVKWSCFSYKLEYREPKFHLLEKEQAIQIVELSKTMTLTAIAAKFKCSITTVSDILKNKRHKWLGVNSNCDLAANNTSGEHGISYDKSRGKWVVSLQKDGKKCFRRFAAREEAVNFRNNLVAPLASD